MLSGCGGNGGTPSPDTQFGHGTASGRHAEAQAVGRTDPFDTLAIDVAAAPNQQVNGSWSIACRVGGGGMAEHDGDTFSGRTPLTVQMRPVTTDFESTCTAVVSATLARSGRLTLELLGS
jgi:hypothetical protein